MNASDNLQRFVTAQDAGNTYQRALAELKGGRKTSHWMWFVFPQIVGLGHSHMSRTYAISSVEEAKAYLGHPVLGARLRECAAVVAGSAVRTAVELFGSIDAQKLQSSMTLFLRADPSEAVFQRVLDRYFDSLSDPATDQRV
ncbi:MAG: NTP pyrophosphohydrolases including oxidative damage repair enzymes [uncultured Chloroflexi bacterium]|uniref:NTP pyrophosphohydrolases including oxidative damage repair enzymes n=1 Tax=uncultured Chloroflexota bacterium TaxID=166587 RepID=A0A6J4JSU3_9CHLR|nr:MAG: NTP pyrophosphohydrolases including oxidative damage repair enzymes [uncultured Chloroflexota bacterium]